MASSVDNDDQTISSAIEMPSSPSSSSTEPTEGRESLPGLDAAEVVPPEISISPPNSCLDATQSEAAVDSDRRLFVLRVDLKDGAILEAVIHNENAFNPREELSVGKSFFRCLMGNSQSFFLSAAIGSSRQRLFSRIRSGRMTHACELLCEFDAHGGMARVSGFALRSAYEPSAGPLAPLTFTTKHAGNCALTHIDLSCIPYLGHLPTDLIGRSLLSFVYAADVHVIRQAHLDLHASRGGVVRSSASLRFVAFNGALVRSETEWSAYVNPWSRRIELVVARHRIVDAPVGDANVLSSPRKGTSTSHSLLPAPFVRVFEEELRGIMARQIPSSQQRSSPTAVVAKQKHHVASALPEGLSQKDIGVYIERLVENFVVNGTASLELPLKNIKDEVEEEPIAQRESQREEYPLPLSYNQINCLENVHRLLKSQSQVDQTIKEIKQEIPEQVAVTIPLTREALQQHTNRLEAEYRATWSRRLSSVTHKRVISMVQEHGSRATDTEDSSPPPTKQAKMSEQWTAAQREEYYRSLAPNPAPPPGHNFHITSMPLPSAEDVAAAVRGPRRSAFVSVSRPIDASSRHFAPLSICTGDAQANRNNYSHSRQISSHHHHISTMKESSTLLLPIQNRH